MPWTVFFILTLSARSFTGLLPLTLHHGPPHELLSQVKLEVEAIIQLFVERHEHQKLSLVGLEILFEKNKVCWFLICLSFVFNADASSQRLGQIQLKQVYLCNSASAIDHHKLRGCFVESTTIFVLKVVEVCQSVNSGLSRNQCDQSFQSPSSRQKAPNFLLA